MENLECYNMANINKLFRYNNASLIIVIQKCTTNEYFYCATNDNVEIKLKTWLKKLIKKSIMVNPCLMRKQKSWGSFKHQFPSQKRLGEKNSFKEVHTSKNSIP